MIKTVRVEGQQWGIGAGLCFQGGDLIIPLADEIQDMPDEVLGRRVKKLIAPARQLQAEYCVAFLEHNPRAIARMASADIDNRLRTLSDYRNHNALHVDGADRWYARLDHERKSRILLLQAMQDAVDCPGFVYVLRHQDACKIGKSNDPHRRIVQELSPKLPHKVEVIRIIPTDNMNVLEADLHARFADKRLNGEWFNLDEADIQQIREIAT